MIVIIMKAMAVRAHDSDNNESDGHDSDNNESDGSECDSE
jgi:hypothetical protein